MANDQDTTCRVCGSSLTDTRRRYCKGECEKRAYREYKRRFAARKRAEDPAARKAKEEAYRERNNELARKRYAEDRESERRKDAEYRAQHRDQMRANDRAYREKHREELARHKREQTAANPDRPGGPKDYYWRNREKVLRYQKEHKADRSAREAARRAGQTQADIAEASTIKAFYAHVKSAQRLQCYWCKRLVAKADRHVDHIVPLSRGGPHVVANLCCSCAECNTRKHNKMPNEWSKQMVLL